MRSDIDICDSLARNIANGKPEHIEIETYELEDEGAILVVHPITPDQCYELRMMLAIALACHGVPVSD